MSASTLKRYSGALVLFVIMVFNVFSQVHDKSTIRFVFYNVENFFDTYDDTTKQDNDFLPLGLMKWNHTRYTDKINSIYKVISAIGGWDTPAIAGFCEIEKKSILNDLINQTYLMKYDFGIIHEESDDLRGIDVCLIYRKDIIRLCFYRYIKPPNIRKEEYKTRSVLYSKWLIAQDTIHIFLNHWPSRRGGVLAEESLRNSISLMIKEKKDSILKSANGEAKIIVAGDFNCTPDDKEIHQLIGMNRKETSGGKGLLVNLSEEAAYKGIGTYKYQGHWEMIDQVIVSDWFINCTKDFYTDKNLIRVFSPGFLLRKDPSYPGFTPFSTYKGYRYQGGFSDHLPVILDLKKR
jgi:hypothetical protein